MKATTEFYTLPRDEKVALYEDILNKGLNLRIKATGRSMTPFLNGDEILTIRKVNSSSLRFGDIIFFRNKDGFPFVHRIIKKQFKNNAYIFQTKGDCLIPFDEPIQEDAILGKVYKIERENSSAEKVLDMESTYFKIINYFLALFGLVKSKTYFAVSRSAFYTSFRSLIK